MPCDADSNNVERKFDEWVAARQYRHIWLLGTKSQWSILASVFGDEVIDIILSHVEAIAVRSFISATRWLFLAFGQGRVWYKCFAATMPRDEECKERHEKWIGFHILTPTAAARAMPAARFDTPLPHVAILFTIYYSWRFTFFPAKKLAPRQLDDLAISRLFVDILTLKPNTWFFLLRDIYALSLNFSEQKSWVRATYMQAFI